MINVLWVVRKTAAMKPNMSRFICYFLHTLYTVNKAVSPVSDSFIFILTGGMALSMHEKLCVCVCVCVCVCKIAKAESRVKFPDLIIWLWFSPGQRWK